NAIFYVGFHPIFQGFSEFGTAMHHGDLGAAAKEIQGHFGGGILGADDDHLLIPVRVSFLEIVGNVREVFAGNVEVIREVVVSGGDDDFRAVVKVAGAEFGFRLNDEFAVIAGDALDLF